MQSTLPVAQGAVFDAQGISRVVGNPRQALHVVRDDTTGALGVVVGSSAEGMSSIASLPPVFPE